MPKYPWESSSSDDDSDESDDDGEIMKMLRGPMKHMREQQREDSSSDASPVDFVKPQSLKPYWVEGNNDDNDPSDDNESVDQVQLESVSEVQDESVSDVPPPVVPETPALAPRQRRRKLKNRSDHTEGNWWEKEDASVEAERLVPEPVSSRSKESGTSVSISDSDSSSSSSSSSSASSSSSSSSSSSTSDDESYESELPPSSRRLETVTSDAVSYRTGESVTDTGDDEEGHVSASHSSEYEEVVLEDASAGRDSPSVASQSSRASPSSRTSQSSRTPHSSQVSPSTVSASLRQQSSSPSRSSSRPSSQRSSIPQSPYEKSGSGTSMSSKMVNTDVEPSIEGSFSQHSVSHHSASRRSGSERPASQNSVSEAPSSQRSKRNRRSRRPASEKTHSTASVHENGRLQPVYEGRKEEDEQQQQQQQHQLGEIYMNDQLGTNEEEVVFDDGINDNTHTGYYDSSQPVDQRVSVDADADEVGKKKKKKGLFSKLFGSVFGGKTKKDKRQQQEQQDDEDDGRDAAFVMPEQTAEATSKVPPRRTDRKRASRRPAPQSANGNDVRDNSVGIGVGDSSHQSPSSRQSGEMDGSIPSSRQPSQRSNVRQNKYDGPVPLPNSSRMSQVSASESHRSVAESTGYPSVAESSRMSGAQADMTSNPEEDDVVGDRDFSDNDGVYTDHVYDDNDDEVDVEQQQQADPSMSRNSSTRHSSSHSHHSSVKGRDASSRMSRRTEDELSFAEESGMAQDVDSVYQQAADQSSRRSIRSRYSDIDAAHNDGARDRLMGYEIGQIDEEDEIYMADPERPDPPGRSKPRERKRRKGGFARTPGCVCCVLSTMLIALVALGIGGYLLYENEFADNDSSPRSQALTFPPTAIPGPTPRPTPLPPDATPSPTAATSAPTSRLTVSPVDSPTMAPTLTLEDRIFLLTRSVSPPSSFANPTTPQSRAVAWLLGNRRLATYDDRKIITRYVLAVFYFTTNGDNWLENTGWLSDADECTWYRVGIIPSCNALQEFANLILTGNNLQGSLPNEISALSSSLGRIHLEGNQLTGNIPTHYGALERLTSFRMSDNSLIGDLPAQIENWPILLDLDVSSNELDGVITPSVGALTRLTSLDLSNNSLGGQLTNRIGDLIQLKRLNLERNLLRGAIPSTMGKMISLIDLNLNENFFTFLPTELGLARALSSLSINQNELSGTLPTQLGTLGNLEKLDLSNNQLIFTIPTHFGNMRRIVEVNLENNNLESSLPTQIGFLTTLQRLNIRSNDFTGFLPLQMAGMESLIKLRVDDNSFVGSFPPGLCSLFDVEISSFYADCSEVDCPCCNFCCEDGESECTCPFKASNPLLCLDP